MGSKISEVSIIFTASGTDQVIAQIQQVNKSQESLVQGAKKVGSGTQAGFNPADNALTEFGKKWQGVVAAATTAAVPIMAAIGAIKKTVEFSREGAELQYLEGRFGALAGSIGTTSTAMMNDLRAATRGMMSDSELMRGATDLMALGLVSTREEAVRLTSVVGSLGWNMDQLTMSITNETTRRLDTLGLSVESVKNRYEELKDSGIEGQRAMMLAITEAGESMIELGGHVADSPLGQWKELESARSTYFDNLKKDLADGMSWWAEFWTAQYKQANSENLYKDLLKQAKEYGLEVKNLPSPYVGNDGREGAFYDEATGATTIAVYDYEAGEQQIIVLTEMIDAHERGIAAQKEFSANMAAGYKAMTDYANGINPVYGEIKSSIEGVFTSSSQMSETFMSDWTAMSQMARDYDSALKQIAENDKNIEQLNRIIGGTATEFNGTKMSVEEAKAKLEELLGVGDDLQAMFDNIAKEMTLSMLQSTFSVDGYSRAEIDALLNYMIDAGMITAEAAEMMKKNYISAVEDANKVELETKIGEIRADYGEYLNGAEYVNGKIIDPKTGEIIADLTKYRAGLDEVARTKFDDMIIKLIVDASEVEDYEPSRKTGYVDYQIGSVSTYTIPNYNIATTRAIGGPVYPNQPYIWQEPGREGELLIPERYGRVMSSVEVVQAMRDALIGGSGAGGNRGSDQQVVNNYYYNYNLTMPTSSNPADVAMAFELMQALGG